MSHLKAVPNPDEWIKAEVYFQYEEIEGQSPEAVKEILELRGHVAVLTAENMMRKRGWIK